MVFLTSCRSPFKVPLIEKRFLALGEVLHIGFGLGFRIAESHYQEADACADGYRPENKQQVHQVRYRNDDYPVQVRNRHWNLEEWNTDQPSQEEHQNRRKDVP